jgi:hypothetical protein
MPPDSAQAPLFSILLPTHNRADVLPCAIRSVLDQTLADWELLIVGDGCTDQTAAVVQGFADPRMVWFDLPKGPHFGYANRNVALRQARGRFIAFMAHDDLWLPDHLQLLRPLLEQPGIELAYSRPLWVIPPGLIAPATFNLEYAPVLRAFLDRKQNCIPAGCVVHSRACFARYGYWNDALPARGDWDMWARIIQGGGQKNFAYLPEPTCLHFRAHWRHRPAVQLESVWEHLHTLEGLIPPALKIPVPAGLTEQQAVLQAMSTNPPEWCRQLRSAVHQVLDQRVTQSDELITAVRSHLPAMRCDPPTLSGPFTSISETLKVLAALARRKIAPRRRRDSH